jgi:hypothetical protein
MDVTATQPLLAQATAAPVGPLALLFALMIGHALADYPLQGKFLAIQKNRHIRLADYTGDTPPTLWVYCLTAHSMVHAGTLWVIFACFHLPHAAAIAFIELILHWFIDFAKCERWTNFHQDQALHILCKIGYVLFLWLGAGALVL